MDFAAILAAYSARFPAGLLSDTGLSSIRDGNQVFSPLAAWLLLAVNAHLVDEATRPVLETALGCDADVAKTFATQMLAEVPSSLALAVAMWSRTKALSDAFADAAAQLPSSIATGKILSQKAADAWAREQTAGLLKKFPIAINSDTALVLASALATHATWDHPFRLADAAELRTDVTGWSGAVSKVLLSSRGHDVFLARTSVGLSAAHVIYSTSGSAVVSVLCAADVSPAATLTAAHEVARLISGSFSSAPVATRVSLFDLWTGALLGGCSITEGNFRTDQAGERRERGTAFLPAWHSEQKYDLLASDAGFSVVADVWTPFLAPKLRPAVIEAAQSCVASYTQHGFDADAVTVVSMTAGASLAEKPAKPPHKGVERVLKVRFGRPFAVTSIVLSEDGVPNSGWVGLPVFDGWITIPAEPVLLS